MKMPILPKWVPMACPPCANWGDIYDVVPDNERRWTFVIDIAVVAGALGFLGLLYWIM